jgi:hypothetical protein
MSPTFFDRVVVHLALELAKNAQQIQDWLYDAAQGNSSTQVYWRSTPHPEQQPRFIDATFTIVSEGPTPRVQVQFGYLYTIRSDRSSKYCRRLPFSSQDLNNHAQSLDLVLDEATPREISASLARALESKLQFRNDDYNYLQCYNEELEQWGSLIIEGLSESELDATCTNLLFHNLRTFSIPDKALTEIDRKGVDNALERLFLQFSASVEVVDEAPVVAGAESSSPRAHVAKQSKAGYRQMPAKKRRRGLSELKLKAND